jgi:hypothetical protein
MSTAKFDTLSNVAGTRTVPVATVVQGSAKAWVNFNGTGTVAIRASFNVTSITDNGTGDYTMNFTTAMQDADYSPSGVVGSVGVVTNTNIASITLATTSFRFVTQNQSSNSAGDRSLVTVQIFR